MKDALYTIAGLAGMIIVVWFIVSYFVNFTRPDAVLEQQEPEVVKYCVVKSAQFGESLIVTSDMYGGDINVLVTPSGGVYVTAP